MRQPTTTMEEFLRVFLFLCSRCSHLESGTLFLRVLASGSHCSGFLGVAFVYVVGAMFGTTVDTCHAAVVWWLWKNLHIFFVVADSFPEALLLQSV